ncbi:ATP-binding protein [Desulfobacula sp.]|uniref:ATP-binding protein n=1 Tax=Candidatus Desulfatibia vada TaxID=2841696 RepID=A0A8J6TLT9_9BACT|nr:ATP-binding protein [Candidatus Desulfatibia vada]MBL6995786.1 ATP-binding protein [Desulfobacula sp.]
MAKKKTIIGKDAIESLTSAMYEDSRFIYREYIQNSADAIDKAVEAGLLASKKDGHIWIETNKKTRYIKIRDDATGISWGQVEDVLKNIAQSPKQRGLDKGFRGIGRLGGLGYCDELRFITSYKGEDSKSIMIWNAKKLNQIINDRTKKEEAAHVIDEVTFVDVEQEDPDEHYFQVELINVNNSILLDREAVEDYLKMVVPVPYQNRFVFRTIIYNSLKEHGLSLDEYNIYINTEQIFKDYTSRIYQADGKAKDEIKDIKPFTINYSDDELLAWGWYSISNFDGVINKVKNKSRGIRLRKDNIQIGSETTLTKLHPQSKNQNYFFGEVHAFNKNLLPNARRDYLIENEHCKFLEKKIRELFDDTLRPIFNYASKLRSNDKSVIYLREKQKEVEKLKKTGVTNKEELETIEQKLEKSKEKAEKSRTYLTNFKGKIEAEDDKVLKQLYDNIVTSEKVNINRTTNRIKNKLDEVPNRTDKYSKLTRKERKLVVKIYEVIDAVLPLDIAENLKLKIDEKFT